MKQFVIVGNGTAAVRCIEGIRSIDREAEVTVISGENRPAYCRPLISYYLEGRTDEQKMLYRSPDFYEVNHCRVIYGKAVMLDPSGKHVILDDGSDIPYDAICIAAGSSPFVPPMEGIDTIEKCFSFMTLDDALALEKAITRESRVLIVGAGLIGLKCAEGLINRVRSITVCDLADRVLSSILDADGAAIIQQQLESAGLRLLLADSVAKFTPHTALMKSGKTIEFDILVTAVGVHANTSLVKNAGGAVGRGITVDKRCATSLPDVFAAGDCTETTDITDGRIKVMALMPNASMQGFTAGVNMAGGSSVFGNAIPMNSIGFFGQHVMTAGSRGTELVCKRGTDTLKKLYTDGKHLTGFEIIGDVRGTGIYTGLIRSLSDISAFEPEQLKKIPDLRLFSVEKRRTMLGGVV